MAMKILTLSSTIALTIAVSQTCLATDQAGESDAKRTTESAKQSRQAHLGLGVSTLPPVLTSHLPEVIGKGRGVLVTQVRDGSPAEKAGLRKYDVLIRYDDQDLYAPEQLVKRVRNEEPGKEVELEYVRSGRLATVKVTLGEAETQSSVTGHWPGLGNDWPGLMKDWPGLSNDWPGFNRRFKFPTIPYRPDFLTEEDDLGDEGTQWTDFESMSLMKDSDGKYRAKVQYKGEDGSMVNREYSGTRQEVRDAIESDKELPNNQRQQLLRSLDDRIDTTSSELEFPKLPSLNWSRRQFNWPGSDL